MNKIKFLGTAGARFVVTKQLRKSGGIWISLDDTNILIDPGPGSLVRILASKPKLNPRDLDGIIITHRHLDHSNDANVLIEAMTNGGFDKKGVVFLPHDAINNEPVVYKNFIEKLDRLEILKQGAKYNIGNISFETPIKHVHGVETYGLNIKGKNITLSIISDTKYFEKLEDYYRGDILIINVVLVESKDHINHLSIEDVKKIIINNKPKLCILTHFGMNIIKKKPWVIAEDLTRETNVKIIAANDGSEIDIDRI